MFYNWINWSLGNVIRIKFLCQLRQRPAGGLRPAPYVLSPHIHQRLRSADPRRRRPLGTPGSIHAQNVWPGAHVSKQTTGHDDGVAARPIMRGGGAQALQRAQGWRGWMCRCRGLPSTACPRGRGLGACHRGRGRSWPRRREAREANREYYYGVFSS